MYVSDRDEPSIQKFSSDGTFIKKWGSEGPADGQFIQPWDVSVSQVEQSLYPIRETTEYRFSQRTAIS